MDDTAELRDLRNRIRQTEAEIKEIREKIALKKAGQFRARQNRVRRSKYPERLTVVSKSKRGDHPGISEESVGELRKIEDEVARKEDEKLELQESNRGLEEEIAVEREEIEKREQRIAELKDQTFKFTEKKREMRARYELTQQKIDECKLEIQSLKRLAHDAESAFYSLNQRKSQPVEDREDQKPDRERIIELDTRIRFLRRQNEKMEDEIRLTEQEIAKPLPNTDEESDILFFLQDPEAETIDDEVLDMSEQLRAGEKRLQHLEKKINRVHRQNTQIEERYTMLLKLSDESIPVSETVTDETVDQLLQRLKHVTQDMDECVDVADQMLREKIIQNCEMEETIKKRLAELEVAQTLFAQKKREYRQQIRAQRDKISQKEAELTDRICEITLKLSKKK